MFTITKLLQQKFIYEVTPRQSSTVIVQTDDVINVTGNLTFIERNNKLTVIPVKKEVFHNVVIEDYSIWGVDLSNCELDSLKVVSKEKTTVRIKHSRITDCYLTNILTLYCENSMLYLRGTITNIKAHYSNLALAKVPNLEKIMGNYNNITIVQSNPKVFCKFSTVACATNHSNLVLASDNENKYYLAYYDGVYTAGCRVFTAKEALSHWTKNLDDYPDVSNRAKTFLKAIKTNEQNIAYNS